MAQRRGLDATAALRSLIALLCLVHIAAAFQYVPDSPCEPQCREGTLTEDAVCLDNLYQDSNNGSRLQECVACLLNSTAVDQAKNETDVEWGLCMDIPCTLPGDLLLTTNQLPCATPCPRACLASRPSECLYRVRARLPASR